MQELRVAVEDIRHLVSKPSVMGVAGKTGMNFTNKLEKPEPADCETSNVTYRLWMFARENMAFIVRAPTQDQAYELVHPFFPHGVMIVHENWLPLGAGRHYDSIVRDGWSHRPPTMYDAVPYKIHYMERKYASQK